MACASRNHFILRDLCACYRLIVCSAPQLLLSCVSSGGNLESKGSESKTPSLLVEASSLGSAASADVFADVGSSEQSGHRPLLRWVLVVMVVVLCLWLLYLGLKASFDSRAVLGKTPVTRSSTVAGVGEKPISASQLGADSAPANAGSTAVISEQLLNTSTGANAVVQMSPVVVSVEVKPTIPTRVTVPTPARKGDAVTGDKQAEALGSGGAVVHGQARQKPHAIQQTDDMEVDLLTALLAYLKRASGDLMSDAKPAVADVVIPDVSNIDACPPANTTVGIKCRLHFCQSAEGDKPAECTQPTGSN